MPCQLDPLRGLDHIVISKPILHGDGLGPLTNFLPHRAAAGNRISPLKLGGHLQMDEGAVG